MSEMKAKRTSVVIVGAGIGGVRAAQVLAEQDVDVTIIDRNNYQLFPPLLYQVSTAVLAESEIAYPVREFFRSHPNVNFYLGEVQDFDTDNQKVITDHGSVDYDYLIVAAGSTTNYFGMKSVEQHAFPMKTMTEAIAIRNQIIRCLERAEQEPDEAKRRELLTFVCVGGGPTGVEEAGAISELIYQSMRRDYHKLNFDEVDIKLMEGTDRVLAMMPEKLRKRTVSILQQKKVDVRLSTAVVDYDGHTIKLKSGESIPTQTVIWAAGVKASPIMAKLGTEAIRDGRINVQKNLSVKGLVNVYAIGDCACFIQQEGERPLATVAPVAMKEAELCATNIIRRMQGASQEVFSYKDRGAMATIGRGAAVLHSGSINMTGFFAWSAWLWVHLFKLAGTYANLTVSLKWMWNYLHNTRLSRILINR